MNTDCFFFFIIFFLLLSLSPTIPFTIPFLQILAKERLHPWGVPTYRHPQFAAACRREDPTYKLTNNTDGWRQQPPRDPGLSVGASLRWWTPRKNCFWQKFFRWLLLLSSSALVAGLARKPMPAKECYSSVYSLRQLASNFRWFTNYLKLLRDTPWTRRGGTGRTKRRRHRAPILLYLDSRPYSPL